ncbi:MAG: alkaline phosphatase family protein [Anaerolineae bacterium]|nr:alkaline phosphatase family protein [Anaerolineae bacterium]
MDWYLRRLFDLVRAIVRRYNARRYGVLAARLGRGDPASDGRRGFVVIQIDALAYDYVREAMARGAMPYLRSLVEQEGHTLLEWRSGVPSSTPAAQSGIMYGNNWDVPAFRWYEKDAQISVVSKIPALVRRIQQRVSQGRPGILAGGSSYSNLMDGGAALSLLTIGALSSQRLFANVRGVGWFLLFLLNPIRLARIIIATLWEYLRSLWERVASQFRPGRRRALNVISPLLQTLVNIVLREVQTFGVMLDMYLGVPAIYVNYLGYDEIAHQEGVLHPEALRVLRGIDARIREIDRARRRHANRPYDLFVLSDHGMTPSVPFKALYGCTLGQYIHSQLGPYVALDEPLGQTTSDKIENRVLLDELAGIEVNLSERGKKLASLLRRYLEDRLPPDPELGWNLQRRGDIVVRDSGPLAHVYFNVTNQPMNLSEIGILYPDLVSRLVDHPGIGLVVGRENGAAVIAMGQGVLSLAQSGPYGSDHPLSIYGDANHLAAELARLASFPHSGDLILLGEWNGRGEIISFEEQWATHGGVGGPQSRPFLLVPPGIYWDLRHVRNAEDLYPFFLSLSAPALLPPPKQAAPMPEQTVILT